jgi:DNA-binding transcriptional regulator LsrR (DeoR family)
MRQQEIAKKMAMSRQRVSRILKRCIETGIVKIIFQENENRNVEFETQLEKVLNLNEIIITYSQNNDIKQAIGVAVSSYLGRVIKDNDIIGFSGGETLSRIVSCLVPIDRKNLTVIQLIGGLNSDNAHHSSDYFVRHTGEILNAKPYLMYAPIIVENKQLRDSMLNESFLSQVFNMMKKCTVALIGIGEIEGFVGMNLISEEEYSLLQRKNAVGEVCTHFFDINGKIIESSINDRMFAIDHNSFKKIPLRVGVGGGSEKIPAILGAVRGGLINVLITDYDTAKLLDQMHKS